MTLENMNLEELRAPDCYEKNLNFLNEMLKYALAHETVHLSSGLVEMQRIFQRYYQELGIQVDQTNQEINLF